MKTHSRRSARTLVALAFIAIVPTVQAQAPSVAHVSRLAWMSGCWQRVAGPRVVEEQWMPPRGGLMIGMSRTTRRDTLVEYEQLRIYERPARAIYAAAPSGQAPAEFETTVTSDSMVVFENPRPDFPQRIIYRRRGNDSLLARIEGTTGGTVRGTDFPYARVACASGPPAAIAPSSPTVADVLQLKYDDLARRIAASFASSAGWMAEMGTPTLQVVSWVSGTGAPNTRTREMLAAAAAQLANAPATAPARDAQSRETIEQLIQRADTVEVLVGGMYAWTSVDANGDFGEKGKDVPRRNVARRRDRWVKVAGEWRLDRSDTVLSEQYANGKLIRRDGVVVR